MLASKKNRSIIILLMGLILIYTSAFSVSAAEVNQTQAQEVHFKADCPIDFDDVIVITTVSMDTGYLRTYYLRPETNYETSPFMPHGKYKIAATIYEDGEETGDAFTFLIRPTSDTLVVTNSIPAPSLTFKVEGYTYSDEPVPGDTEGQDGTDVSDTADEAGTNEDLSNAGEQTDTPDEQESQENPAIKESHDSLWRSLIFSVLAIVTFFAIGCIYRRYKEGR